MARKKAVKKDDIKKAVLAEKDINEDLPKEEITLDDIVEALAKLSKQIGVIEEVLIYKGIYVPGMEIRKLSPKHEEHLRLLRERMHKENEIK